MASSRCGQIGMTNETQFVVLVGHIQAYRSPVLMDLWCLQIAHIHKSGDLVKFVPITDRQTNGQTNHFTLAHACGLNIHLTKSML